MEVEDVRSVVATYINSTALNVLNKLNTAEAGNIKKPMKKPQVQNAFNTPGLFKIDMTSFKRSSAGMVGGAARAKSSKGDAVPQLNTKNADKHKLRGRGKDEEA